MGSSSSKFRKHLQHGDEYAALQLYNNNSDLRKALDPNLSYGDNYHHDTPLHLAARHGMKALLRIFLFRHGGNPNKKNSRNETTLHNVCMTSNGRNLVVQQRRTDCLLLVLQWTGGQLENGEVEKVDLGATDEKDNTALHYAAASGLKRCVELLVSHNAPLFTENSQKQTPCDCAEKCGHSDIALYLESKMVFSGEGEDTENLELETIMDQIETTEPACSLRAQDLQEAKDQLLVETSDMLRVPLFTAEALLRNHEWSRETLLEAWMEDPIACCDKCGVVPPASVCEPEPVTSQYEAVASTSEDPRAMLDDHELRTPIPEMNAPLNEVICDICASLIAARDGGAVSMTCDHQFCRTCWQRYLTGKINEGEAHNITCPGFNCTKLVPVDVIETLVPRDIARRYLQFDIKAFVDSNPSIKWCPSPGCGRAVRLPESENPLSPSFRGSYDPNITNDFSHAVDCGNGHIFCWECMGEAHEPASCDNWQKWYQKMAEIQPEQLSGTEEETEIAANCLWLVTNSKTCPNCKSPIQKNEGCNHMKCSKCKHDFCWVCLEPWKRHSSTTGGYFRCNRYEVVKKVQEGQESAKSDAEQNNKKMQELNRFVHYYTRFRNHENSFKLEEPLLTTAKEKMMVLAKAVTDPDTANLETQFVQDAVHQLLKGRRVLKCSYVYGFYLGETGYKKPIFEFMQTELEECIETLSEMIARPYLRTPRSKIIQAAALVHRKRLELLTAISKGLVPTDTSPSLRKKKGRYTKELDEDLKKALLESLADIDPANPWVKDSTGKHTNVSALLDWPEEEDESEDESETMESTELSSNGGDDICVREGCRKKRVKNPRTGAAHEHCSITCMQADRQRDKEASEREEVFVDYQMDLLRALEMSRLQFLREMGQLRPGSGTSQRSPVSPRPDSDTSEQGTTSISSLILQDASLTPLSRPPLHAPAPATLPEVDSADSALTALVGERSSKWAEEKPEGDEGKKTVKIPVENVDVSSSPEISGDPVRRGRVLSEPGHRARAQTTGSSDTELQRAIEMSRLSLREEDRDLRLAIELSLKDSLSSQNLEHGKAPPSSDQPTAKKNQSKSDEEIQRNPEYSSIVQRVPNRSVEDLAQDEGLEMLGAYGGAPLSPKPHKSKQMKNETLSSNSFGLIKDISVANINIGGEDKTKDFEDKRLAFMTESKQYSKGDNNLILAEASLAKAEPRSEHRESRFHVRLPHFGGNPACSDEILVIDESPLPPAVPEVKNVRYLTKRHNNEMNKNPEPAIREPVGRKEQSATSVKPFVVNQALNNAPQSKTTTKPENDNREELNPDDLHIDPDLLESMIQGAEGYHRNNIRGDPVEESRPRELRNEDENEKSAEKILLLERTNQNSEQEKEDGGENDDDEGAVFV